MLARKNLEQKVNEAELKLKNKKDKVYKLEEEIKTINKTYASVAEVADPNKAKPKTLIKLEQLIEKKMSKVTKAKAEVITAELDVNSLSKAKKEAEINELQQEIDEEIGEGVITPAEEKKEEQFKENVKTKQSQAATKRHAGKSNAQKKLDMLPAQKGRKLKNVTDTNKRKKIELDFAKKQAALDEQIRKEEKEQEATAPEEDEKATAPEEGATTQEEGAPPPPRRKKPTPPQRRKKTKKMIHELMKPEHASEKLAELVREEGELLEEKRKEEEKKYPNPAKISDLFDKLLGNFTAQEQEKDRSERPEAYEEGERRRAPKQLGKYVKGVKDVMEKSREKFKILDTITERARRFKGGSAISEHALIESDFSVNMVHYDDSYNDVFDDIEAGGLSREAFERLTGSSAPRRPPLTEERHAVYSDGRDLNTGSINQDFDEKYGDVRPEDIDLSVDIRNNEQQIRQARDALRTILNGPSMAIRDDNKEVKDADIDIETEQQNFISNIEEVQDFISESKNEFEIVDNDIEDLEEEAHGMVGGSPQPPPTLWERYVQQYLPQRRAQRRRPGNENFIREFMRNNRIRSNVDLGGMSNRAINSLATNLGRAGNINSFQARYGVNLELFNELRQWGALDPVLNHPRVQNTQVGRGLAELNKQTMKGGKLVNLGSKFGSIMEGIMAGGQIIEKGMAGDPSVVPELIKVSKGARSGVTVYQGVKKIINKARDIEGPTKTKTETRGMTDQESRIIEELERLNKLQRAPQDRRPEQVVIGQYYKLPPPSERRNANLLIQNAVNSYMNDKNLFGSYYDVHDI